MHRSMIKVLILVSRLKRLRIGELSNRVGLSYTQTLNILRELDRLGLVRLKRGEVESVAFIGDLITRLSENYPLEEVLVGRTPVILSKIIEPKSAREISEQLGFTEKYIWRVLNSLSTKGVVLKENNKYELVDDPLLRALIIQLSKILEGVEPESRVIYRDNYYVIKELPKGTKAIGTPTALSVFPKYGIDIETNREIYIYPPKKLELEEVIIHSLLAAKNKQENTLTAIMYAKHYYDVDNAKLLFYAKWYKQTDKLVQLENYLNGTEEPIFLSWSDFIELAEQYGVDLERFKEKTFSEDVLRKIGEKLEDGVEIVLFGGAAMVIKGYKTSTKDIDIGVKDKGSLNAIKSTLRKLGYEQKTKTEILVFEHEKLPRVDIYPQKIGKLIITKTIEKRAHRRTYGKLNALIASDTELLLTKLTSGRARDIEDAKILIRRGEIDWKALVEELRRQEEETKRHHCLTLLIALEEIEKQLKTHIPYKRTLTKMTTEHMVEKAYREYGLRNPKDIRRLIDISEETIRRIIRDLKRRRKIQEDQ